MPSPDQIHQSLYEIANKWQGIAIFWHVYCAGLVLGFLGGVRPPKRLVAIMVVLPMFSVSALAWLSGNPFSGMTFAVAGGAMIFIAYKLPDSSVELTSGWLLLAGVVMFVFGWIYPHFLESESFFAYMYSAPTGLLPCPTLSIVIGLSLITGNFGSQAWAVVLVIIGLLYALLGTLYLGLALDFMLLIGSVMVVISVLLNRRGNENADLY